MRQKYVEGSKQISGKLVGDSVLGKEDQEHPALDKILSELKEGLKVDYFGTTTNQAKSVEKEKTQSLNPELKRLVDDKNKRKQKLIAQKAQEWLNELDPLSGEGLWFSDLAKHYPSPLAAAIALLNNESI
ncbi:hypothetical protein D082_50700 (plasmid) [Synechocystis sp. PCC 6714]|nr:hypothetical protein D082_50700 [Synechocystis sp. PCC 6714]